MKLFGYSFWILALVSIFMIRNLHAVEAPSEQNQESKPIGFYLANTITADILNATDRLTEHNFVDTLPTRTWIFIADVIGAFNNKYLIPYIFSLDLDFTFKRMYL